MLIDDLFGYSGEFYIIQIVPEYDINRVKIGFTTTLEKDLQKVRVYNPYAEVVKSWPCSRLWEDETIEYITENCEEIGESSTNLYQCHFDQLMSLASEFFEDKFFVNRESYSYLTDEQFKLGEIYRSYMKRKWNEEI